MARRKATTSSPIFTNRFKYRGDWGDKSAYYGIVECQLGLPELTGFQKDVLMLVIDDSPYGKRVPVQLGTLHIDMILKATEQNPTLQLRDSWE